MRYTAKKVATMLLTMVIVSFLTFVAFSLLSGDAATRLLGTEATPEKLEALRIQLGLNDPLPVRYGHWLAGAVRGDLGTSYQYGLPVTALIAQRHSLPACTEKYARSARHLSGHDRGRSSGGQCGH